MSSSPNLAQTVTVPERFRGPPSSGNGGYVCGLFAGLLTGGRFDLPEQQAAEVTLRAPVPLDRAIAVRIEAPPRSAGAVPPTEGGVLRAHHGETLIAEASLASLQLEVPEPASWDEAMAVREHSPSLKVGVHAWLGGTRKGVH